MSACTSAVEPSAFRGKVEQSLSLPNGVWYRSGARAWEADCIPSAFLDEFFGGDPQYAWVLYLGTDTSVFCEMLYALCETEAEALSLSSFLSARLAQNKERAGDAYAESLLDATVYRKGKAVLYTACPLNKRVIALLR